MPHSRRPLLLIMSAVFALLAALLLWAVVGLLRGTVGLWHDLQTLPGWLQVALMVVAGLVLGTLVWLATFVVRRRGRPARSASPATRTDVERRLDALQQR